MRDIRIITLHKQHYMDEYGEKSLKCQYSCWGYYDGLDVEIAEGNSILFNKKSKAPISETWYGLGKSIQKLQGRSSCQNIGIFRCSSDKNAAIGEKFWGEHEKMPLFGVIFLQLKEREKYYEISQRIEVEFTYDKEGKKVSALSYCTFDNADLVVLVQSNSVIALENVAKQIREREDVTYSNSILGISESFLSLYNGEHEKWNGYEINIEEQIYKIRLNLVTAGRANLKGYIKDKLQTCAASNISIYRLSGHDDLLIEISNTSIKTLIEFLCPDGFVTHQNGLYGNEIYSIATSIVVEEEQWEVIESAMVPQKKDIEVNSWFRERIERYSGQMDQILEMGDESLYSYYQALLRTLNLLVQFEKFEMSKKIFYLIYPTFELFDKLLYKVMNKRELDDKAMEMVKVDICSFLNSVNSLIYHIIHTDQMFLMIPGYNGTSFSIPIKMCSLYAWFTQEIIQILNDKVEFKHRCLLIPVMESKPETSLMDMGVSSGERIIKINLSQRTLYMPRHLMLILSHEVAHYVGEQMRMRKKRLDCIIRTIAAAIAEGIIPHDICTRDDLFYECVMQKQARIRQYIMAKLSNSIKNITKDKYHASSIFGALIDECTKILTDESQGIYKDIYFIPSNFIKVLESDSDNYIKNLQRIHELQKQFDDNRKQIVAYNGVSNVLNVLLKVYREVFSDIVALSVLEVDMECYIEAFRISEGMDIPSISENVESAVRKTMARYCCNPGNVKNYIEGVSQKAEADTPADRIVSELFLYESTIKMLREYVDECKESIKNHIDKPENKSKRQIASTIKN